MASNDLPDSLPSLPASFIETYKSDTNKFVTWLAIAGEKCGFRLSSSKQIVSEPSDGSAETKVSGLKGRARKLAKEANRAVQNPISITKTLPLRDFIPLAKRIASFTKPRPQIPLSVIKKLERAIDLRQRCASWFHVRPHSAVSAASNQSHQNFIEVLVKVLDILRPLCSPVMNGGEEETHQSKDKPAKDADPLVKLYNSFEALTVEAAEEEEDLANLTLHHTRAKVGRPTKVEKSTFVPEPRSRDDEFMLGCFCFFQDLQEVRSFLQGIWQRYYDKVITLVTASLVTTAAFDFIQRVEQRFNATFSQSGDYYDCFVDQMFRRACTAREHLFLAKRDFEITAENLIDTQPYVDDMAEEADWIMLPSWHSLKRCTTLNLEDEGRSPAKDRTIQVPDGDMTKFWQDFEKDPFYTRRKGQQMIDEALLSSCLTTFHDQAHGSGGDAFRMGVKEMMVTKVIPAWLVLATQNFLDIHHIFKGDISRGSHEFQQTREVIRTRLDQHIEELEKNPGVKSWDDCDRNSLDKYRNSFFADDAKDVPTLFALNPVGAGLREFFTVSYYRWKGVETVNSMDTMGMAHLYHAAQLESRCASWPDMDFVVHAQTAEIIFWGGLPTNFEQCCLKAHLAIGGSIQSHSTTDRTKSPVRRRGKFQSNRLLVANDIPFTTILSTRSLGSQPRDVERTAENLELVLNATLRGIDRSKFNIDRDGKLLHRAELMKLTLRKPQPTLRHLLVALEESLMQETPILYFDFYGFRLVCHTLLKTIHAQTKAGWVRTLRGSSFEEGPRPMFCTPIVPQEILTMTKCCRLWEKTFNLPGWSERVLNEVAEMLEEYIGRNGSAGVNDLRQFASGGLAWAGYQARMGGSVLTSASTSLSNDDAQAPRVPRRTLSSITDDELRRSGLWGRDAVLEVAVSGESELRRALLRL